MHACRAGCVAWRLHPYRLPLARRYEWARGAQTERAGALVWCDGGWGEIAYPPDASFDAGHVARALDAAAPSGDLRVEGIEDPRVRCGASTALLDSGARQDRRRLCDALDAGRPRSTVAVNALITGDDVEVQVAEAAALGIHVLKIKCGADRGRDLARVAAVRQAAPDATLRLDANASWSPEWALEHMEGLASFGIDYVEQPLPPREEAAMARLAAHAPFAVALDESATDVAAIVRLLRLGAGQVVILKPQRLGGPDRVVEAMRAAKEEGARVVLTNSLESSVGVHAALHCASLLPDDEACGLATSRFLAKDVAPVPAITAGRMAVPRLPGLGVDPTPPAATAGSGKWATEPA